MIRPLYIHAATSISPQHSFNAENLLQPIVSSNDGRLVAVDADYSKFINPVAIRRMSRILKMSISAALQCLKNAGIESPDAIITGTGRGSVNDMETFLKEIIDLKEEALNPTLFIQSTYNAPNGWIAQQAKSTGYNQTYVHRGHSLELALLDAQMLLAEDAGYEHILVGSYDELTSHFYAIKEKLGYWKKEPVSSIELLSANKDIGSIPGEASSFFLVSGQKEKAIAKLQALDMLSEHSEESLSALVDEVLSREGISYDDVDLVLSGRNGDVRFEKLYDAGLSRFNDNTTIGAFKHLCGEFETSIGFAFWLATKLLQHQQIPEAVTVKAGKSREIKNILVVNHFIQNNATVALMQRA